MRVDLKDKKDKIRIVAVRLAEQMKHHILMYEERHIAMDKELKQVADNLDKKQKSAEKEMMQSIEEMDKDITDGFVKVGECVDNLQQQMENKNKLFEDKMREAITSVNDILSKEGTAWRNQIREISLINEMHQHIILESFQNSNGHIDNLEKCLSDLSEELMENFKTVEERIVQIRAEFNTTGLISKIQGNMRFKGMSNEMEKIRKGWRRDTKRIEGRIDEERTNAMGMINPMKMVINKLKNDMIENEKKVDTIKGEMEKGTGGLREEMQKVQDDINTINTKNNGLKEEMEKHMRDQDKLLKEYKEGMESNRIDIVKEFNDKCDELQKIDEHRVTETKRLIQEEGKRLKENIHAQNHSIWERLVIKESSDKEDFLVDLMKQNQANFFSFLVGPEDKYKIPHNDLDGTKKEWDQKERDNGRVDVKQMESSQSNTLKEDT